MENKQLYTKIISGIDKSLNEMGLIHHRPDYTKSLILIQKFFNDLYLLPGLTVGIQSFDTNYKRCIITRNASYAEYPENTFNKGDKLIYFKSFGSFLSTVHNIVKDYHSVFVYKQFRFRIEGLDDQPVKQKLLNLGFIENEYKLASDPYNQHTQPKIISGIDISIDMLFQNIESIYNILYSVSGKLQKALINEKFEKFQNFFRNLYQMTDTTVCINRYQCYIEAGEKPVPDELFNKICNEYVESEAPFEKFINSLFGYGTEGSFVYGNALGILFPDDIYKSDNRNTQFAIAMLSDDENKMLCKSGFKMSQDMHAYISLVNLYDNIDEIYSVFYEDENN